MSGARRDGVTGIDLGHVDYNGPVFLKNIRVEGFDVGLRTAFSVYPVNVENAEFLGQDAAVIRNRGQILNLRQVRSTNAVPTVLNTDGTGMISLIDSQISGRRAKRPEAALQNRGLLFVRDLTTAGCTDQSVTNLIENDVGTGAQFSGALVDEYFSHRPFNMFPSPFHTLRLAVKETPEVPWDPLNRWASPLQYGGRPDDTRDDSAAIQAAIDSGATTVYQPKGKWVINAPVEIRGSVRRFLGCEARVFLGTLQGGSALKVLGPTNQPLVIERLEVEPASKVLIQHEANRPLVVRSCLGANLVWPGPGELFLEEVQLAGVLRMSSGQKLWARSWANSYEGPKLINDGGEAWLFGFKSALGGTLIETTGGGKSELLGVLCNSSGVWKADPMFRSRDPSAVFVIGESS